ncbi:OmpP1/FadL family transporter [Imhoffiella purpurea]|uniref:Long-chain fatty acid transport protein n=1 Tax=Imhoffiella purpurea TaxID=1249627 RepID=W9VGV6_9GAMM|nr:porin [Imhoffiella purpurea]EXJ15282.1 Long-chain fatty acid transport protein [Imhoffiella purpurea]
MLNNRITYSIACVLAAGTLGVQQSSFAAGFMLPEASILGMSTANAVVANPDEIGAIPYNPAAMAFQEGSSISAGTILIGPSFSVKTASGDHDSQGADWQVTPQIQAVFKLNDQWNIGFGVTTPFGLETRWEDGTFPAVSGTRRLPVPPPLDPNVPLSHPLSSKLEVLDMVPSASYRVNDQLSVAAGLDVYWVKSAKLNSTAGGLSGDGTGLGFNLSALYREGPWSFGASYRSAATVELDGDFTAKSSTLVALGVLGPSQSAELDLDLPWRLQIGARYVFNARLAVEFDITRTGWSEFNDLKATGKGSGSVLFSDQNDWDDANAYRIGATYQLNDKTQLRFGYSYDETGQGDDHFSARVPDSDRHLFGIGVAQALGDGFQFEAGYMYVLAEERKYRSNTTYTGHDLNGTTALDGDYSMDAHLIGLQVVKTF